MRHGSCRIALTLAVALAAALPLRPAAAADPLPAPASAPQRNTRHALIIAIGQYQRSDVPPLAGVRHDIVSARQMAQAMAVPDSRITVLRDGEATADRIRAEIAALQGRMADGDRLFIYYSGHGTRWYDESVQRDGCIEGLLAADGKVLTNVEIGQRLAPLARRADKMLVFYDACFSGGVAGAPFRTRSLRIGDVAITPKFARSAAPEMCAKPSNFRSRSLAPGMTQREPALAQNVVHIAASRPDEVSFDNSATGGLATSAWRDCLLGQARDLDGSGAVTADEVTRCAQAKVSAALADQAGITGQQMVVAGNGAFVPAWMGAAFAPAVLPVAPAPPAPSAPAPVPVSVPLSPPAPARATPGEILAEVHRQRDGGRPVAASARQKRLRIGRDALQIDITPARDGYLYIAQAGSDGKSLYLLYPNELAPDNRVRAGQRVALPGKGWEVVAGGPAGVETLLVMVTDAPRDIATLGSEKAGPFMKTLLDDEGRARLQWVLSNGTPGKDCGKPGMPGCSDAFGAALLTVETVP